ncbi:zinc ribbon domain-containing protein [Leptothermofonsia sichuanensis E412]|uniref:zinc ribbon domain-containing protein n=1 Tax=Leptothermofonsia sichuanensis TaxID=2917832 RepID=UPI001CA75CAA|nr:zinc ribbon domain-containing protein [Leptothermofonsia sichuanensis]QZZ22995.1 zinc ribbon domain-containing protein [Leptothermofonsia sichuanensis E412]
MAYVCELVSGQRVHLDNMGTQTIVTVSTTSPGQQQQSSCGFQTGVWTAAPEVSQTAGGAVIKIMTAEGQYFVQVQGNSVSMMGGAHAGAGFQQMQTATSTSSSVMPPMKPMEPMKMGDMQMNMNPMEMRMGDMEMRMGANARSTTAGSTTGTRRFCSQCGVAVKVGDRFCSSCGHPLD